MGRRIGVDTRSLRVMLCRVFGREVARWQSRKVAKTSKRLHVRRRRKRRIRWVNVDNGARAMLAMLASKLRDKVLRMRRMCAVVGRRRRSDALVRIKASQRGIVPVPGPTRPRQACKCSAVHCLLAPLHLPTLVCRPSSFSCFPHASVPTSSSQGIDSWAPRRPTATAAARLAQATAAATVCPWTRPSA